MSRAAMLYARFTASEKLAALSSRRRMSIEDLALVFQASGACSAVPRDTLDIARWLVSLEDAECAIVGQTFAETVALSSPFLDLYEASPFVRRIA